MLYHKNSENLDADRIFLKVVKLASGEYCWQLGIAGLFSAWLAIRCSLRQVQPVIEKMIASASIHV